jgi:hypothetical protein
VRVLTDGSRVVTHAVSVDLCDPAVELRATAPDEGGRTTSTWARSVGAAVAVNGDYFDLGTLHPLGPARGRGRWWPAVPRHEHRDALFAAAADEAPAIFDAPDRTTHDVLWNDASARVASRFTEVVAIRARVLVHGAVSLNGRLPHDGRRHPRTGIGLSADSHTLYFFVADGPGGESGGLTARELAESLRDLGAREGMKLDGGGSSTLFLAGRGVINRPSDGGERVVANHFGVRIRGDAPRGVRRYCAVETRTTRGARAPLGAEGALASLLAVALGLTQKIRSRIV